MSDNESTDFQDADDIVIVPFGKSVDVDWPDNNEGVYIFRRSEIRRINTEPLIPFFIGQSLC